MAVPYPPGGVSTRRQLSRHTCPVLSPKLSVRGNFSFPTLPLPETEELHMIWADQQDHSNLLRRLATSRPQEVFRERRASFLSCEAAMRATKSREVALSSLTGCQLRFAPNMGRSITRIWGFRLHFREYQTSMAECIDSTPTKTIECVCVSPT